MWIQRLFDKKTEEDEQQPEILHTEQTEQFLKQSNEVSIKGKTLSKSPFTNEKLSDNDNLQHITPIAHEQAELTMKDFEN